MITTPRLLLRYFVEQDYTALHAYLSNPVIYKYEPGAPITLEEARKLATQRSRSTDFWAVVLCSSGQLIGHLYFQQTEPEEFLTWELGYIFNPQFQNQGYASEASSALIHHGFETMGIHRVMAHCNPENIASWRVMEKIGMRREGYFRKNIFFEREDDGEPIWLDTYEYAILKEDC